jgi:hypothetical protein
VKKNGATPVDAKSLNVSIIEAEQWVARNHRYGSSRAVPVSDTAGYGGDTRRLSMGGRGGCWAGDVLRALVRSCWACCSCWSIISERVLEWKLRPADGAVGCQLHGRRHAQLGLRWLHLSSNQGHVSGGFMGLLLAAQAPRFSSLFLLLV